MERTSAEVLSRRLLALTSEANGSLRTVMTNDSIVVARAYSGLVGRLLGYTYTGILAPLWHRFPELEPSSMQAPAANPPALSQQSSVALQELVVHARSELSFLRGLPASEALSASSLAELESVVVAIEEFLRDPAHGAS